MKTSELIREIQNLPMRQRIYVIERTMHLMRKQEETEQMERASEELYADYVSDRELTIFTNLDIENFYEAR